MSAGTATGSRTYRWRWPQHNVRVEWCACDLGSADGVEALADTALARFGGIDILVNNTGGPPAGVVTSVDIGTWLRQFDQMVMSLIRLTGRLLPGMRARAAGAGS